MQTFSCVKKMIRECIKTRRCAGFMNKIVNIMCFPYKAIWKKTQTQRYDIKCRWKLDKGKRTYQKIRTQYAPTKNNNQNFDFWHPLETPLMHFWKLKWKEIRMLSLFCPENGIICDLICNITIKVHEWLRS